MIKSELANIKSDYELFNVLLFNNSLPRSTNINFMLHRLAYAAGFSRHRDKPTKNGNIHDIAFCAYYKFTRQQIREILIHEMIHLWQDTHVAEWRYKRCSNDIAHDRVFMSKMNTINVILQRKEFDLKISDVFKEKLELDERVSATREHCIFFLEDFGGNRTMFKTRVETYDDIVKEIKELMKDENNTIKNAYVIKSKLYVYNLLECNKSVPMYLKPAEDNNTKEDLYEKNLDSADWIVKDENFVK